MRIAFTGESFGSVVDEDVIAVSVVHGGQWLNFQRDVEGSFDDWGIHLEYSDQINGDYGCVELCRVRPSALSVELGRQLGTLIGVTGFDVSLPNNPNDYRKFIEGLRQVFRGHESKLIVDET